MDMNWIPTQEKLPEAFGNYLVTVKMNYMDVNEDIGHYYFVTIDHYVGLGKWSNHNRRADKVIAWMNIPDKYEELER